MPLKEAIFKVQCEVSKVHKDGRNQQTNSRYSTLEAIFDVLNDALAKHHIVVIQQPNKMEHGWDLVTTVSTPPDKEELVVHTPLLGLDDGRNKMQALGSAITYARRYALLSVFKLAQSEKDDDDGNSLTKPQKSNLEFRESNQPEIKMPLKNYATVAQANRIGVSDPGDYYLAIGKNAGKKLSDVPHTDILGLLDWIRKQPNKSKILTETFSMASVYLDSLESA